MKCKREIQNQMYRSSVWIELDLKAIYSQGTTNLDRIGELSNPFCSQRKVLAEVGCIPLYYVLLSPTLLYAT